MNHIITSEAKFRQRVIKYSYKHCIPEDRTNRKNDGIGSYGLHMTDERVLRFPDVFVTIYGEEGKPLRIGAPLFRRV